MLRTTHRTLALLIFGSLAVALAAVLVIPGLGLAQEATPAGETGVPEAQLLSQGEEIYNRTCIACHQAGGTGAESEVTFTHYPALAGNAYVTTDDPTALIHTVLTGRAGMPSFRGMSDEDLASVTTYIRQSWGNDASAVQPDEVTEVRDSLPTAERSVATPVPLEPLMVTPES